jgi:very-short-patch-repair endonuclease
MTLPEVRPWEALRGSAMNGKPFRRQHAIGKSVLDVDAPSAKRAIEVDGAAHDIPSVGRRDFARYAWLEPRIIGAMRFDTRDILDAERRDERVATLAAAVLFA